MLEKCLAVLLAIATTGAASAGQLFKCTAPDGQVIYINQPTRNGSSCIALTPSKADIDKFRKNLKPGDTANKGLVIEVKPPLAKVQTVDSERWFRIDQLEPAR